MSVDLSTQKQQEEQARKMLLELIAACPRLHRTPEDEQLVRKAFELANDAHRGMYRKSGELYIFHPVAVARIAAMEIGLGTKGVVSALLHDVVEDTDLTVKDIENIFGDKVAAIVDGLTKLENVFDQTSSQQVETFRKLMMSMVDDVRVILVKLSDRLHNMRTLESMPGHKRYRIAAETLYVYAPIAHRLGLFLIKTELEDLSLKYEHPQVYNLLKEKIQSNESDYNKVIESISEPVRKRLDEQGLKYTISSRPKSIYSIWHKMQTKNVPFEEIYDILAMRIVFEPKENANEKTQCWVIYSIITDLFSPKPDRLRDWISTPKANGYEALHTTVMSPYGRWVEVQIRSKRMDEVAELGLAAHWKYKEDENENSEGSQDIDRWIGEIRKMLESVDTNSIEFLDAFKLNLFASEIILFTPKGEMKKMPVGSTVLDFAYEIHSKKIGNHCIGAKVNYKLVPLSHELRSGDQVEIICSERQTPKYEWLDFVTTAKAKAEIRSIFKEERKELCDKGKQLLEEELQKRKISLTVRVINKMLQYHHILTREDLFYQIGKGVITFENIEKVLRQKSASKWVKIWKLTFGKSKNEEEDEAPEDDEMQFPKKKNIVLSDDHMHEYQVAPCCNPIPGDDVVAYMDEENKIILHSRRCPNAMKLMSSRGDRILSAEWQSHKVLSYLVEISISGTDRQGLVSDVTGIITRELNVTMRSVSFDAHDGVFEGSVFLYIHNAQDLKDLIDKISKVKGVHNVSRKERSEVNNGI